MRQRQEVWLASLRQPRERSGPAGDQARVAEEECRQRLSDIVASGITFHSLTVQVSDPQCACGPDDCSPAWDYHLIHDSNLEAHEASVRMKALEGEPLSLCAVVALCASGCWAGTDTPLEIEPDRFDGTTQPVRYVHCQMRILHTPPAERLASPEAMPKSPPWPLPQVADVERAQPDAVPPLDIAQRLAREGRFRCEKPPAVPDSQQASRFTSLRGLVPKVPRPVDVSAVADALNRLADRTGGLRECHDGVTRLRLDGTGDLRVLVRQIERSDFLSATGAARAAGSSDDTYKTMREVMFGLVDGSPLPGGVLHPTTGTPDSRRLVWTDPKGVAPSHAPADSSDILPRPEPHTDLSPPVDQEDEELGEDSAAEDPGSSHAEPTKRQSGRSPTEAAMKPRVAATGSVTEVKPARPRDTLMERLADAIRSGLGEARRGFVKNCVLPSLDNEYEDAVKAQKQARWISAMLVLSVAAIAALAVDQRWPYLAALWEFVTPFDATRSIDPAIWPTGWLLILALTLAAGLLLVRVLAKRMARSLQRLEQRNAERRRIEVHSRHYASEVLRLYGISQQFADHRLLITEFLHRPFGPGFDDESTTMSRQDLVFEPAPPYSMLISYANVDSQKYDEVRRQEQESAVEPGWLNRIHGRVKSRWHDHYSERITGEFKDPDHDITDSSSVVYRNRHDGSEVLGPRADFRHSAVRDSNSEASGWATRRVATERVRSSMDSDGFVEDHLKLLASAERVHGPGLSDPVSFFRFADGRHSFDWEYLLKPVADRPAPMRGTTTTQNPLIVDTPAGRSIVIAWRLDLSAPVPPRDQAGWRTSETDDHRTVTSRSVV